MNLNNTGRVTNDAGQRAPANLVELSDRKLARILEPKAIAHSQQVELRRNEAGERGSDDAVARVDGPLGNTTGEHVNVVDARVSASQRRHCVGRHEIDEVAEAADSRQATQLAVEDVRLQAYIRWGCLVQVKRCASRVASTVV